MFNYQYVKYSALLQTESTLSITGNCITFALSLTSDYFKQHVMHVNFSLIQVTHQWWPWSFQLEGILSNIFQCEMYTNDKIIYLMYAGFFFFLIHSKPIFVLQMKLKFAKDLYVELGKIVSTPIRYSLLDHIKGISVARVQTSLTFGKAFFIL